MTTNNNEEIQNQENGENAEGKAKKIIKRFTNNLQRLTAVTNGNIQDPDRLKIPKDELGGLMEELFKEEKEQLTKEVKEELKNLLRAYATYQKEKRAKEKELEQLDLKKMTEFSDKAEKVFNRMENVHEVQRDYYQGLSIASKASAEKAPDASQNE